MIYNLYKQEHHTKARKYLGEFFSVYTCEEFVRNLDEKGSYYLYVAGQGNNEVPLFHISYDYKQEQYFTYLYDSECFRLIGD